MALSALNGSGGASRPRLAGVSGAGPTSSRTRGVPAVLLDKDGTLLIDEPYNVRPERMRFIPGTEQALRTLTLLGMKLVVVTNQPGVAHGFFPPEALDVVARRLTGMFAACNARLAGFYFCPHHPQGKVGQYALYCTCRKPMPGLLLRAALEQQIDLSASWFIGDILNDIEAGNRAGCKTILLDNGHETEWNWGSYRQPGAQYRRPSYIVRTLDEAAQRIAAHTLSPQPPPHLERA